MPSCFLGYTDHSAWWRAMRVYFRGRGVTNDNKIESLCYRWAAQKGYRLPNT